MPVLIVLIAIALIAIIIELAAYVLFAAIVGFVVYLIIMAGSKALTRKQQTCIDMAAEMYASTKDADKKIAGAQARIGREADGHHNDAVAVGVVTGFAALVAPGAVIGLAIGGPLLYLGYRIWK